MTHTCSWHSSNPQELHVTLSEEEKSQQAIQSLRQITVKVSSRIGPPYLRYATPKNGEELKGNARYEGYSMDLIAAIADFLDFEFEFELAADGKYGNYDPKAKAWNGLIKDLLDRVWVCYLIVSFIELIKANLFLNVFIKITFELCINNIDFVISNKIYFL